MKVLLNNLSQIEEEQTDMQFMQTCYLDETSEQDDGEGTDNEDNKIATEHWYFVEKYGNEFDMFRKYFKAIKKFRKILKIIEEVNENVSPCSTFEDVDETFYSHPAVSSVVAPLLSSLNETLYSASNSVCKGFYFGKGRCIYAKKNIKLGEVLIREKATILCNKPTCKCIGNKEHSLFRCHHCAKPTLSFERCPTCDICVFCSNECLSEANNEYHIYECYGLQRHFWRSDDYSFLAMRMMLYGAARRFDKSSPQTYFNEERYGDEDNNYPAIYALKSHFEIFSVQEWNIILYNVSRTIIYLLEKTIFFHRVQFQSPKMSPYDLIMLVGGLMVKHYIQAICNAVVVDMPNPAAKSILNSICYRTRGIYPTTALLNHSCKPNAAIIAFDNYVVVKAIRNISKDEEITIAYCEIFPLLEYWKRQAIAEHLFNFKCICEHCLVQSRFPDNCFSCDNCKGRAVEEINSGKVHVICRDCNGRVGVRFYNHCKVEIAYRNRKYKQSNHMKHLESVAHFSKMIYHKHSIKLYNVYMDLANIYMMRLCNPFKILRYCEKAIEIMEQTFSPAFLPLLLIQVEMFSNFSKCLTSDNENLMDKEINARKILKDALRRLPNLKKHLLHYVHASKLKMFTEIENELKSLQAKLE